MLYPFKIPCLAQTPLLEDMRVVLIGYTAGGKTSAVNIILGREGSHMFQRTRHCMKGEGCVAGRQITLVDTPGWWSNSLLANTDGSIQREIVRSVSMCPPGPHAVLVVIRTDCAFQERSRAGLQEHLGLLREHVWRHALVLFTYGDWLGEASIDTHIANEGEALQWLVKNCGNRYHVLDNKDRGDTAQVTELLEKIEDIVAANNGCHFDYKHKRNTVQDQNIPQEENVELQPVLTNNMTDNRQVMGDHKNDFGPPNSKLPLLSQSMDFSPPTSESI